MILDPREIIRNYSDSKLFICQGCPSDADQSPGVVHIPRKTKVFPGQPTLGALSCRPFKQLRLCWRQKTLVLHLSNSIGLNPVQALQSAMSNICYVNDFRVGVYDTHHTRDDMNTQFASKCKKSTDLLDPNLKVHQASFQAYKEENEDRTVVLHTHYGLIIGVFDGTQIHSFHRFVELRINLQVIMLLQYQNTLLSI